MTATALRTPQQERLGLALVCGATFAWSANGFFTRLLGTDMWTTLAGRAGFGATFLLLAFVIGNGRASGRLFFSMTWAGVGFAILSAACAVFTITALYNTSVADCAVIGATSPFVVAAMARIALGEAISRRTVVTGLAALVGVAVVVSGALGNGRSTGDLLAMGMTTSFAAMIVVSRAHPAMPQTPPNILAALLTFAVAAPLSALTAAPLREQGLLAAFGFTSFVLASLLFVAGSRRLPASESALIFTLDIVFSPVLVWAVFGEQLTWRSIVGGTIVFVSVATNILLRERIRPAAGIAPAA